jgi:hypothetical protein
MRAWRVAVLGALATGLSVFVACGRQSTLPASVSDVAPTGDQLPFDRQGQRGGISPTSAVIPPGANVPAGTTVTVRLQYPVSSARDHAGETFAAVLDEPIVVNGQTIAERGTPVMGRIVEAAPGTSAAIPGYLRLALSSIMIGHNVAVVQTSSQFAKGGSHQRASLVNGGIVGRGGRLLSAAAANDGSAGARDISIGPERRLTFRLTEPLPLPVRD